MKHSIWTRFRFAWVTGGFFLISLVGHWVFGWFASANDQASHGQAASFEGLDTILRKVDRDDGDRLIEEIDRDYAGRHTDHRYVRERQS